MSSITGILGIDTLVGAKNNLQIVGEANHLMEYYKLLMNGYHR